MLRRHKMIIQIERSGHESSREVRSFRSCLGMLKKLKRQAKRTDPLARIMVLNGVPTLVVHREGPPSMFTVRLAETGSKAKK